MAAAVVAAVGLESLKDITSICGDFAKSFLFFNGSSYLQQQSGDGLTACVGGSYDCGSKGAVWFYTRANPGSFSWIQQGSMIV